MLGLRLQSSLVVESVERSSHIQKKRLLLLLSIRKPVSRLFWSPDLVKSLANKLAWPSSTRCQLTLRPQQSKKLNIDTIRPLEEDRTKKQQAKYQDEPFVDRIPPKSCKCARYRSRATDHPCSLPTRPVMHAKYCLPVCAPS